MGERFIAEAGLFCGFDRESCEALLRGLIDSGILLVADDLSGMVGGAVYPHPFNANHMTGCELFWWSEGAHGTALLEAIEAEAKARGCQSWTMIALEALRPEAVGALYRRRGYALKEHGYTRVF